MKLFLTLVSALLAISIQSIFATTDSFLFVENAHASRDCSWTVVGAGPAGIIVVGLLIDLGISPQEICWIDPEFTVGRLSMYADVPANTKTKLFVQFLRSCISFQACKTASVECLCAFDPEQECPLALITQPLQDITDYLCTQVHAIKGTITSLDFEDNSWLVRCNQHAPIRSEHVVLATGSHPKSLNYDCANEISLDSALNKQQLAQQIQPTDSIAVIGGSHSAILVMKFLTEMKVARIINFYKHPLQYAIDMGTWLLHNANGLKGIAAHWAREVLEKNPPANLIRLQNTPDILNAWLPVCNKIIYAVGYDRNELPLINGSAQVSYDDHSGIIAPRLFGIGIAFPEEHTDPLGNHEHRVGLNSFMDYAQRVLPQWMQKDIRSRLASFEQLFNINIL